MIFFIIAILAGVFTVLAPCILPLLPIVIGATEEGETRRISKRALVVIFSLSFSVIVFTLLLKASTLLIDIPQSFWSSFSGVVVVLVGLAIVFPNLWSRVPFIQTLSTLGNKAVGTGYQKKNYTGDMLIGFALGPVFTTCSPTYLFIIATVLPASLLLGFVYLLGFTLGLAVSLCLIAYFGQKIVNKISAHMQTAGRVKQFFGVLIIIVGVAIFTGYDKKLETLILDSGYGATINLEDGLIERFAPESMNIEKTNPIPNDISSAKSEDNSLDGAVKIKPKLEVITLAGGCFWCTEAYFQESNGVIDAVSGYAGGPKEDASYKEVSSGNTKHREAVRVTYDPKVISTEEILDIFWSHIDPTNKNGQFADSGFQYTTAIFYHTQEQESVAKDSKARLEQSGLFDEPIATTILPFSTFYEAEEYHQDYYKKASEYYERYKKASGRAGFVEDTWAKDAAIKFLEESETKSIN